jgi:hypothetical protein
VPSSATEPEAAQALLCATCGYDLRAQPRDGICPECATPIEKSIAVAAIPLRPAWRDSDPRWRRRMVAGAWVMVLYPLLTVLQRYGLTGRIHVPVPWYVGDLPLQESFVTFVYAWLVFCVGVVLFFSKERFRRRNPLDWTRRWGVLTSYCVLLLGVPLHAVVTSLVMIGISALFMTLPPENQPAMTGLLIDLGAGYLLYGPHGSDHLETAVAAFSAAAILLACVPIYDALRASGPRLLALGLLAPLAAIALYQIALAVIYYLHPPSIGTAILPTYFFYPDFLVSGFGDLRGIVGAGFWSFLRIFVPEAVKWLCFLGIALWLTIAQAAAWRRQSTQPAPA